ncbi:val start codon [Sutterella sp. CAG:351]|nr:val start codon [Sutterella sp. CAG:351]
MVVVRGRDRKDVRYAFEHHFLAAVAVILLILLERNQILDRASLGARAAGRHHIGVVDQVKPAEIREAHNLVMRARDNQLIAGILVTEFAGVASHAAAVLGLVIRKILALDVTVAAERDHNILSRNQIKLIKIRIAGRIDLRAAGIAVLFLDVEKIIGDDLHHTLILRENVEVVSNLGAEFLIGGNDAFLLRRGESLETHIENAFRLHAGEPVEAIRAETAVRFHILRPVVTVVACHGADHLVHDLRVPALAHQAVTGLGAVGG